MSKTVIIENWSIPGVLYTAYLESVTGKELIEYTLATSGDERFDDVNFIIGDWSGVSHTSISPDDVKQLVACLTSVARICPDATNASIVNRNDTGLGLTAWYRHLAEQISWKIDIFHNTREAFAHYGLDFEALGENTVVSLSAVHNYPPSL